jgi:arginine decarboxylase
MKTDNRERIVEEKRMIIKTPSTHFFTCGSAEGSSIKNSQDGALVAARIGNINPVLIGSIIPPGSRQIEVQKLPQGALVPVIYASIYSVVPGELISAGVAVAYPKDPTQAALVMEYASRGHKEDIEAIVRKMAEEGLKMRSQETKDILSISVQHKVARIGTALAAVVLWD